MLLKSQLALGISLSANNIIITGVQKQSKTVALTKNVQLSIPPQTFSEGLILERAPLVEILASFVKENKLKGTPTVIGVNPRQAVIRSVRLPQMPEKELRKALEFEIDRYSSMANSPFTMDFIRQGKVEEEGVPQEDLLTIAVKDSVLHELCALIKDAGLKVKAVDLEPNAFAYLRVFAAEQGVWPVLEEDWVGMELGNGKAIIAFFRRDILQFVHTIPHTLNFAFESYILEDILREVQRSLDYYHLNMKKPQPQAIYVWGLQADQAIPQFRQALPYNFAQLSLSSLAPLLQIAEASLGDEAVLALGMALREVVK